MRRFFALAVTGSLVVGVLPACGGDAFEEATDATGGAAGASAGSGGSAGASAGSGGTAGGSAGATGGSAGATGGSAGATGGSAGATGGSAGATGGSAGATGGSAGATGGSAGATGGSAGATGGSAGATGGSAGATGGSAGATGGSAGATGGSAGATGGSAGATGGSAGATGGSAGATGGSAGAGGSSCSFDACSAAPADKPPSSTCTTCTQAVCKQHPSCCSNAWDEACAMFAQLNQECGCGGLLCGGVSVSVGMGKCWQGGGACNPVTGGGCALSQPPNQCTLSTDSGQPKAFCTQIGDRPPCTECNPSSGKNCQQGSSCVAGVCVRLCCLNAECGVGGTCAAGLIPGDGELGICLK